MTSLAMIAGMVPMALALGEGGEQSAPLGRAVIGGLLAATFATLFVLPSVFALVQRRASTRSASLDPDDPAEHLLLAHFSRGRPSRGRPRMNDVCRLEPIRELFPRGGQSRPCVTLRFDPRCPAPRTAQIGTVADGSRRGS